MEHILVYACPLYLVKVIFWSSLKYGHLYLESQNETVKSNYRCPHIDIKYILKIYIQVHKKQVKIALHFQNKQMFLKTYQKY